jgi:hypothetical protein
LQDFPQFLMERGLTLPDYHKLSAEKQQYLKETWQLEQGGSRAKRYGIDEGRDRAQRKRDLPSGSSASSSSWLWLCLVVAALGAGAWLFITLVRGAKTQIQADGPSHPTSRTSSR